MSDGPQPSFGAVIDEGGSPVFDNPKAFARWVQSFRGRRVRFEVRPERRLRTIPQNKRLRVIYNAMAEYTGHHPDEIHEICKARLLPRRQFDMPGDVTMDAAPTTTTLTTLTFGEYMDRCEQLGYEFGMAPIKWDYYR